MPLSIEDVDRIAERWDSESWDQHERAFARQWMTQAQEDVRALVALVRELQGKAHAVADDARSLAADTGSSAADAEQLAADAAGVDASVEKLGRIVTD